MKPDGGSISDMRRFYLRGCGPLWRVDFRRGMGSHWTGRRVAALLCRRVSTEGFRFRGGHVSRLARTIDGADFHTGRLCEKLGGRSDVARGNSLLHNAGQA